jgi:uncharacterized protein YbaR (Trm112 family)
VTCPVCLQAYSETCPVCLDRLGAYKTRDLPVVVQQLYVVNVPSCHRLVWGDPEQSHLVCLQCGHGWPVGSPVDALLTVCPAAVTTGRGPA